MTAFAATGALPTAALPPDGGEAARVVAFGFTNRPEGAALNIGGDAAEAAFLVRPGTVLEFRRTLAQLGGFAGEAVPDFGAIVIPNMDGALDFLARYSLDGRRVVVKMGGTDFTYDEFGTVYEGTASGIFAERDQIRIPLRSRAFLLDRPLQTRMYGGAGGYDGGEDLAGKPLPVCYGRCNNVSPVVVDAANLVYQFHDGAAESVSAVYDRGVALASGGDTGDLYAGSTSPGEYRTDLSRGLLQLGSSPAGLVTADVRGSKTGGVYVETPSAVLRRLVTERGGLRDPADLDPAGFANLASETSAPVGLYVASVENLDAVLARFCAGFGGYQGFTRLGLYSTGRLKAPSGSPVQAFTAADIVQGGIERLPLPPPIAVPQWRTRVAWGRNWTLQAQDLAGAVTDARRAYLREALRYAVGLSMATRARHVMAIDAAPADAFFDQEADAVAEATRLALLYGAERALYRIRPKTLPFLLDLGQVVRLTLDRFGLEDGADFRAVAITERITATAQDVELELFG